LNRATKCGQTIGINTKFRTPRFRNVGGMWIAIVPLVGRARRPRHAAALLLPANSREAAPA